MATASFNDHLNYGLLRYQGMLDELQSMIVALDSNEYIDIDGISEKSKRVFLNRLFQMIPDICYTANRGWSKASEESKIAESIVLKLLESKEIVKPSEISTSQSISYRFGMPRVLLLLETFPDLKSELPAFLEDLIEAGSVDLSNIADEDLSVDLGKFLLSIGLRMGTEGEHCIPDGSKGQDCKDALSDILYSLQRSQRVEAILSKETTTSASHNKDKIKRSSSSRPSRSDSSSDDNSKVSSGMESEAGESDNEVDVDLKKYKNSNKGIVVIGPSVPSAAQFKQAESLAQRCIGKQAAENNDSEDEEDDRAASGPRPMDNAERDKYLVEAARLRAVAARNAVPLGGLEESSETLAAGGQSSSSSSEVVEREEWMMTPGENGSLAGLIGPLGGSNRTFQTGKQAKKLAQAFASAREAGARAVAATAAARGESLVPSEDDNDESQYRGPSLMQMHLDKRGEALQQKQSGAASKQSVERRPFDREIDVLARKKMTLAQAHELAENSKQLGSRFDKGSIQKGAY